MRLQVFNTTIFHQHKTSAHHCCTIIAARLRSQCRSSTHVVAVTGSFAAAGANWRCCYVACGAGFGVKARPKWTNFASDAYLARYKCFRCIAVFVSSVRVTFSLKSRRRQLQATPTFFWMRVTCSSGLILIPYSSNVFIRLSRSSFWCAWYHSRHAFLNPGSASSQIFSQLQ